MTTRKRTRKTQRTVYGLYESPRKQPRYAKEALRIWGELLARLEGYGPAEVSRHTGISQPRCSDLLNGRRGAEIGPMLHTCIALADAAGYRLKLVRKTQP